MNFQISNLLKNPLKKKSHLAVDIGTASIKMVELDVGKGKLFLKNYAILTTSGHLERLNDAIQTSSLKIIDKETASLLRLVLRQMKTKATLAVASLPAFSIFSALIDLPIMSPAEVSKTMQYQARSFIPLPLTEVTIDWLPISQFEDKQGVKKQRLFLTAVPNEQIKRYQNIFRLAGLNLQRLRWKPCLWRGS